MTHRIKRKPHKMKARQNIVKTKGFWYVVLALLSLLVVFYFVIFFDKIQIKNISISGNNKIPTNQIESLILREINKKILFVKEKSIFLVNASRIKNIVLGNFPVIREAQVTRRFFNTLDVIIQERTPQAIFCQLSSSTGSGQEEEDCFFMDETGIPFEEVQPTESYSLLIVRQYDNKAVVLGKQAVNAETLGHILKVAKSLNDKYGVSVDSANVASDIRLNVETAEGWEVYFNLSADMDLQIAKLILLLEKEIPKESREQLKYIDLRFKDRAYYK